MICKQHGFSDGLLGRESDNVHFITMELIEGQPLDRLISANDLLVEQIIEIAGAIAEALATAHQLCTAT